MKIGLPQALLYYRYAGLWKTFFEELGCEVVLSGMSDQQLLSQGDSLSDSECCLPVKSFLGHVDRLAGHCDFVLVPRFERLSKNEEFCVRFWGLTDIVRATFPGLDVLSYNLQGHKPGNELMGFLKVGSTLGKNRTQCLSAYLRSKNAQKAADAQAIKEQNRLLEEPGLKILIATQPYISHDPLIGGSLLKILREQGAVPVFADRCERSLCKSRSAELTTSLYWVMNKEVAGAIQLLRPYTDGAILVSAFPCGTDCLVNDLILRRVKGFPITQIILDGQQGEAGLQTRIECFLDIIKEKKRGHAS